MKTVSSLLILFLAFVASISINAQRALIPMPEKAVWHNGNHVIRKSSTISYDNLPNGKRAAEYLQAAIQQQTGIRLDIRQGKGGDFHLSGTYPVSKGYELTVKKNHVSISGNDEESIASGIATLRQLISGRKIACVKITDKPRFGWRGFHLDCSRHFFSVAEVKEVIDLMALYKLNRFHWHLTDDQGWRIEIKRYPQLTQGGAWRTYNNQDSICMRRAAKEGNPDLLLPDKHLKVNAKDTLYGGFYTQEDIREIVAFAHQRGIEVIPEIDMPGHMLAAIHQLKGLSCSEKAGWGKVFTSPLCPGKDTVMEFCRHVWEEVIGLFPYEYVHIGGDEVEKDNWKACPDCQKRMADHQLKNEEELQAWFIHDMERFINGKGKKMIGWDEILEGGLSKTATVMWWRTWAPRVIQEATAHGNNVIVTPISPFYFSEPEKPSSLQDIYNYQVVSSSLSTEQQERVLGVQGNLWTEWIPSRNRLMYLYFPRILALSELAWCQEDVKDFNSFSERLTVHYRLLEQLGVPYRLPFLEGVRHLNAFVDSAQVNVTCSIPDIAVRYTLDGTLPTPESPLLTNSLLVDQTTHFTFRPFTKDNRAGELYRSSYVKQGFLASVNPPQILSQGLTAFRYEFKGNTCKRIHEAVFTSSHHIEDVCIPPGVKGNIGLIIKGYIRIPEDGIYTFALTSDDGSTLKIDGNMVVDNDREQSPHEEIGQIALKSGLHHIEIRYFDHNGGMLRLNVFDKHQKKLTPKELFFYGKGLTQIGH